MTKRILFVDDEPMVLRGIERGLRSMRHEWEMSFVEGGPQALQVLSEKDFDVVVTDMRMPGMDGAELLLQVRNRFPRTVRMALSGQSDRETVFRAIGPTHQYLSKPCDADQIKQKLIEALALRDLLDNTELKEEVSRIDKLPSQPAAYDSLCALLGSSNPSLLEASRIIARDPGMTAKLLQLVNSAFLGSPLHTLSLEKIVSALGLANLKTLVLSVGLFSRFEETDDAPMQEIWQECRQNSIYARAIAQCENAPPETMDAASVAGLLHDVGRLVLQTDPCAEHRHRITAHAAAKNISITTAESELLGCTHAQVGGYLLGLWGVPRAVVDAVAWHHEPAKGKPAGFCPLIAVHAADGLFWAAQSPAKLPEAAGVDESLLEALALKARLPVWKDACQEAAAAAGTHG